MSFFGSSNLKKKPKYKPCVCILISRNIRHIILILIKTMDKIRKYRYPHEILGYFVQMCSNTLRDLVTLSSFTLHSKVLGLYTYTCYSNP